MCDSTYDCFTFIQQEYLVCVTIHKARNLSVFNADTYVKVSLDKKNKSTKVFQNSENPYFNEYFVFELFCSLNELLRLTILFQVFKQSCYRRDTNLGEIFIDLTTIWNQPGHTFYKRWGKLESALGQADLKSRGHIQVDLTIVSKNEPPAPAVFQYHDHDDIEKNLLQPDYETQDAENVRHYITVYKGMFLKKTDYIVQVSFAGFHGKTKVAKGTTHPEWNEQFSFSWFYPSLCRTFLVQVKANELLQWKCISNYEIHFDDITFPGTLPSFGPTYLHLYDSLQPQSYVGRIMISINSEKLEKNVSRPRCTLTKMVPALMESSFWPIENFVIMALIWQGDFIHVNSSNIKFGIRCGEWCSNLVEAFLVSNKCSTYKHFRQDPPHRIIRLSGYFPDCRFKFEADQFLNDLFQIMKAQLYNYKLFEIKHTNNEALHAKCLRTIVSSFKKKVVNEKKNIQYAGFKELTEWDKHRQDYVTAYLAELISSFDHFRKMLKSSRKNYLANIRKVYTELVVVTKEIELLLEQRIQDTWPDLILQVLCSGTVIASCRLNASDYMFSSRSNCTGRLSGRRHNMVFKSINCQHTCRNCGCITGKVDGWIWIGTEIESNGYCNPPGWTLKESMFYDVSEETGFTCKVYIHQAKVRPSNDKYHGQCDAQARVTFLNYVQDTKITCQTLSPVWNQVITFNNILLPGGCQSYIENPPLIALEFFCIDAKGASDYFGCGILRPVVRTLGNENQLQALYERSPSFRTADSPVKKKVPLKQLKALATMFPPPLKWVPIAVDGVTLAEILVSAELIETKDVQEGEMIKVIANLPKDICPVNKKYKFEVIFAGLRSFQNFLNKATAGRYRVKLLFADLSLISGPSRIKCGESINFQDMYATGLVNLPEQQEYWPPIILNHVEYIKDNREHAIGAAMLSNSHKYLMASVASCSGSRSVTFASDYEDEDDRGSNISRFPNLEMETSFLTESYIESTPLIEEGRKLHKSPKDNASFFAKLKAILFRKTGQITKDDDHGTTRSGEDEFNWWTKFYNSIHEANDDDEAHHNKKHRLVIYGSELENQSDFSYLQDWAESISLLRGIRRKRNCPPKEESYCNVKCHIEIRRCKSLHSKLNADSNVLKNIVNVRYQELAASTTEVPVVVRVYVVQGLRIRSRDRYSSSDSYVKLQFGSKSISDRANYIQNQAYPVFGKLFQLEGVIPREHILHISVYDRDIFDDLIGCTNIDLEDRLRSKHRACVGIANEYSTKGYNVWRDTKTPLDILNEICLKHDLGPPEFIGDKIHVAGKTFSDSTRLAKGECPQNKLCLTALKNLHEIPQIGYKLVPEHVETRSLYRSSRPGIEQGKLQLWVEIYESDKVPPPIDITPIPPKTYELRIVVLNTFGVILDEKNIFGKKMSDIYVRGWLEDIEKSQYTDVHYRSLNGEGNFNWRMIFPLRYSRVEDMMVILKKAAIYEQFGTELKYPAVLYIQIWDNDTLSPDDFLGVLNINLSHFQAPFPTAKKCCLKHENKFMNIFNEGRVRGWFPAKGTLDNGTIGLTGSIELEIEIFDEDAASAQPAGMGRDPPQPLTPPIRPETSFNWFSNPLKSLKHIIIPQLKKCLCYLLIIVIVIAIGVAVIYSLPGTLFKGIFRF